MGVRQLPLGENGTSFTAYVTIVVAAKQQDEEFGKNRAKRSEDAEKKESAAPENGS
jgi:hypothetical protein